MAAQDPWGATDRLDAAVLQKMSARLEARGRDRRFAGMIDAYLDATGAEAAREVLDFGCGTGVVARQLAARPGFGGAVLGIDLSPALLEDAARFAAGEGLGRCRFEHRDIATLADARFDLTIAHTLLCHVPDPRALLAEMVRVTRPGGRIVVFDGDYESLTCELGDIERSRKADARHIAAITRHPRLLRRLPRDLKALGLAIDAIQPGHIVDAGRAEFWATSIEGFRTIGPRSGLFTEAEANAWADELMAASAEGVFFGACSYYAYLLTRPG